MGETKIVSKPSTLESGTPESLDGGEFDNRSQNPLAPFSIADGSAVREFMLNQHQRPRVPILSIVRSDSDMVPKFNRDVYQQVQRTPEFPRKVAILGAGAYGPAMAKVLADNGVDVQLWTRNEQVAEQLNREHTSSYLGGAKLAPSVSVTTDLPEVLDDRGVIFLATPSATLEAVTSRFIPHPEAVVVNLAKGFIFKGGNPFMTPEDYRTGPDPNTEVTLPLTMLGELPHWGGFDRLAMISGPGFAKNIIKGACFGLAVAAEDISMAERVGALLENGQVHVFATRDCVSVQVAAAMKNVVALAAGMAESLRENGEGGANYFLEEGKVFLLQRGLAEMISIAQTYAEAHGKCAKHRTMHGMAGIGDLLLTCTSEKSRNFSMGRELGRGTPVEEAISKLQITAEGMGGAWGAKLLVDQLSTRLANIARIEGEKVESRKLWAPISNAVVDVMCGHNKPSRLFEVLFKRLATLEQWEGSFRSDIARYCIKEQSPK